MTGAAMNILPIVLCAIVFAGAGQPKVTAVDSRFDKNVNFGTFRTYSWIRGYDAHDPAVHKLIVAAVEEEMTRLGMQKVEAGADVTIAYYTVRSAEVDLSAIDRLPPEDQGNAPQKMLGRLLVIMRKPADEARLWSASTRDYVTNDPVVLNETIRRVATRLFATYPTHKAKP
jgi:hypothetical protein